MCSFSDPLAAGSEGEDVLIRETLYPGPEVEIPQSSPCMQALPKGVILASMASSLISILLEKIPKLKKNKIENI